MNQCLGMSYEEIGNVFEEWDTNGELVRMKNGDRSFLQGPWDSHVYLDT